MRRPGTVVVSATLAAVILAGACSSAPGRPAAPNALEQVLPAAALDVAAIRATALAFVRAYADTAADQGLALSRVVAGPALAEWVRWLAVQNGQFDGTIMGSATIGNVTFVAVASNERYDAAQVLLAASVTFRYRPFGAQPFERTRVLDGPMTLVRTGIEDWRVIDVTRDGLALSDGVRDLGDQRATADGVTVELHSAFLFSAGWQFNVTVENASGGPVRLEGVTLTTGAGSVDGVATGPLLAIASGTGAIGIIAFAAGTDLTGPVLELRYGSDAGPIVLRMDLAATIGELPGASPTPAPTI